MLLRSERPDRLDDTGCQQVRDLGVRTVLDLRQTAERESHPVVASDDLTAVHVDLDRLDDQDFWADFRANHHCGTPVHCLPYLAAMPERIVAVLHAIAAAPPGGVLFHCA